MAVSIYPISGLPMIHEGDDLPRLIAKALADDGELAGLCDGDVVVVCQKVVSKAEGRIVALGVVKPGTEADQFAKAFDKDPRVVELALSEAEEVLRMQDGHLITQTAGGFICANSGIDRSNQNHPDEVTLLPVDSDRSAERIREHLARHFGCAPAVIVSDTFGRPWRLGQVDVAIGAAGMEVLDDYNGETDWSGRDLSFTLLAIADQLAAASGLVVGKADGIPVVVIRGVSVKPGTAKARDLVRQKDSDLFR